MYILRLCSSPNFPITVLIWGSLIATRVSGKVESVRAEVSALVYRRCANEKWYSPCPWIDDQEWATKSYLYFVFASIDKFPRSFRYSLSWPCRWGRPGAWQFWPADTKHKQDVQQILFQFFIVDISLRISHSYSTPFTCNKKYHEYCPIKVPIHLSIWFTFPNS